MFAYCLYKIQWLICISEGILLAIDKWMSKLKPMSFNITIYSKINEICLII